MTARIPHQLPVPCPDVRVPRGMWRRIAQAKIRECWRLAERVERLKEEIAELRGRR